MEKQCSVCLQVKPLDDFYSFSKARAHIGDGHDKRCKECVKVRATTPEMLERCRANRKKRVKTEKEKEKNRQWCRNYAKTEIGKQKRREINKRHYWKNRDKLLLDQSIYRRTEAFKIAIQTYRETYPERRKAQIIVSNAIASGHLLRPSVCSVCNAPCKPDAHHFDYTKPLEVIWACKKCHAAYRRID